MLTRSGMGEELALVICSYRPDYERCARLCASLDRFSTPQVAQYIIVPDRDRQLFAPLETTNRLLVSTQDVLPAGFYHLPLLRKWWLDSGLWPVRGWVMQQLTKLCADVVTDRENILFIDSDIEFISPLQHDRFAHGDTLRLHRKPLEKREGIHLKWHHAAADLLGLPPRYFGSDYIGALATWKRSNLIRLKEHIEHTMERPWFEAVGRRLTISEYTLYGVFVEHVLGLEDSGHFSDDKDVCHCLWFEDETEKFITDVDHESPPQAVLVQSNIGLDQQQVNQLMGRVRQHLTVTA